MAKKRALFLDRDGTLIKDAHYLKDPAKLEIIASAGSALQRVKDAKILLFMHTNQSGIARGYYDWSDVHSCNSRMYEEFGWPEDFFCEVCIAPESPEEKEGYRKPSPRFELEMIEKFDLDPSKSWVVGDKWIDPQCGINAGMRGALVKTGKHVDNNTKEKSREAKVPIYPDLPSFVSSELTL